ncbi:MAG TPA: DUF3618 domain-containing protein [Acidimicrobiia bacterium]|nr:DUF3618 domain-containing protein [Acidimicrobiia bacterium]
MDERATELKRDMEERRSAISETVDQIENRVNPSHVAARGKYRMRTRLTELKENIMGQSDGSMTDRMSDRAGEIGDSVRHAPENIERRTRGNPIAVGLISVGAGALIASLLPETRQERRIAREMEPQIRQAVEEVKDVGKDLADDARQSASEGVERVKESARSAGEDVMDEARQAGERVNR